MKRPWWHHLVIPALLAVGAVGVWDHTRGGAPTYTVDTAQHGPVTEADTCTEGGR